MQGTFSPKDVNFLALQTAVFCVQCELISQNNTTRCLACGSSALLSLSRILGGSLRRQEPARLIADAELDKLVRSLLHSIPESASLEDVESISAPSGSLRHHFRFRHKASEPHGPAAADIETGEFDLEPGISIIAERAQALTGATGAAIALRKGDEIVCRARAGRTAPDIGVRLQTDTGLSADCVRTGEVLLCDDAERNPRVDLASCRRLGARSILVAPLRHYRRTLGVFEVLSGIPHAFDHHDVATMQFLSGMMVAAITRLSKTNSPFAGIAAESHAS